MIDILADQVEQLTARCLGELRIRADLVHLRKLCPNKDASRIAHAVEIVAMLVVCAANNRASDFLQERDVFLHIGLGNRPAFVRPILVTVDAVQMIRLSVQKESFLRIDAVVSDAKRLFDCIAHNAILRAQFHDCFIEVRVFASVP